MNFILDNWYVIVLILAVIALAVLYIRKFFGMPTDEQLEKVKAFLLVIVIEAERQFGEKTGKIKLSWAYSKFVEAFPAIANMISFEMFSLLVDEVLEEMRHLLESNDKIAQYVGGDENVSS